MSSAHVDGYEEVSSGDLIAAYEVMLLARQFENACNQAYMQGHIRGFMHLDNGQEGITALVGDAIRPTDIKYSYYREHTHALASSVSADAIMAELFGKIGGTCKGAGGSMHIYDKDTFFQGGWALVAEQLPYAAGAARSILLDRNRDPAKYEGTIGSRSSSSARAARRTGAWPRRLNAAAKENLPLLFIVIDNGRAINTFTEDVAANLDVYRQGVHYGVPGMKVGDARAQSRRRRVMPEASRLRPQVDAQNVDDVLRAGRAVVDHVRTKGPAILQLHTYRFNGHSPADPEHERGRKEEKKVGAREHRSNQDLRVEALGYGRR